MENRPDSTGENGRTVESVLQTVTQDLKRLHQGVITQLSQEVSQLQAEKARLAAEVRTLRSQSQALQTQNQQALSQQQVAQQQIWAKQLALALANHLQGLMMQQIDQAIKANQLQSGGMSLPGSDIHSDNAHRLLASLDSTFNTTFKSLQQELNSYQSALSQQLNRMHTLEQQGEAVLEALVNRLREQLQAEAANSGQWSGTATPLMAPPTSSNGEAFQGVSTGRSPLDAPGLPQPNQSPQAFQGYANQTSPQDYAPLTPSDRPPTQTAATPPVVPGTPSAKSPADAKKDASNFWLGLTLVLLSTVALSVHNVAVRVIGSPSSILGLPPMGGFIDITVLGNSLLILWLRMLFVVPLMLALARVLYPPVWHDLKRFFHAQDWRLIFNPVVGSGVFLFLSQVLIYIAIGKIGAGPAVTILFMYPVVTVPLAWLIFGDRPTPLRWIVMGIILMGVFLTALPSITATGKGLSLDGFAIAVFSGVAFALYIILMQLGFKKKLHPVPVSLIQFFTIFVLTSIILIFLGPNLGVNVLAKNQGGFIMSGVILGVLTLVGYLTNNFGVRFMGAGLASIVASIGPAMTALLAWVLIGSQLQGTQVGGILFVTIGVGMLSIERMKLQKRPPKRAST